MAKKLTGFSVALGSHHCMQLRGGGKGSPFSAFLGWVLPGARARLSAAIHPGTVANSALAYRKGGDTKRGQGKQPVQNAGISMEPTMRRGLSITSLSVKGQCQ